MRGEAASAHITEATEAGTVPFLQVTNNADHPLLLLDGEELLGAKQNRILNTTVLV
ncbi:MAG: ARPP-1 family domain-containing protein, partial [Acidimicrobiia bacterium]